MRKKNNAEMSAGNQSNAKMRGESTCEENPSHSCKSLRGIYLFGFVIEGGGEKMETYLCEWEGKLTTAYYKWMREAERLVQEGVLWQTKKMWDVSKVKEIFDPYVRKLKTLYENESRDNVWMACGSKTVW